MVMAHYISEKAILPNSYVTDQLLDLFILALTKNLQWILPQSIGLQAITHVLEALKRIMAEHCAQKLIVIR